jgi:hypothetical protein
MDVGSPIRQPVSAPTPGQFQQVPSQGPVVTELPKPQSVEAPNTAEAVRVDVNPQAERRAKFESEADQRRKQFVVDEKTKDMVVRTVDRESGEVIAQFPDDWQIKQRAYSRAMLEKQLAAQTTVDRTGDFAESIALSA